MDIEAEKQIIRQVRDGALEAYAELVTAYQHAVYNLVFRLTGSIEDAEDLSQETFLKALEAMDRFDESRPFFPWLYTIALNVVRNHCRRQSFLPPGSRSASNPPAESGSKDPESLVGRKQAAERLFECVQQLPEPQREAMVLRYYQDLSFEMLAEILEISLSAAKMRVYRGLQRLSLLMNPENKDRQEN